MSIQRKLSESATYTKDGIIGHWKRYLFLLIGSIVFPIINGYSVMVMSGKEPAPETGSVWKLFVDGIKLILIQIGYFIIPILVLIITSVIAVIMAFPIDGTLEMELNTTDNPFLLFVLFPGLIGSIGLFFILTFIVSLFASMGMVQFARTGSMTSAFELGDIVTRIRNIGWGKYILSLIAIWLIVGIVTIVTSLIYLPDTMEMIILSMLISILVTPILTIFYSRYLSLLYDDGEKAGSGE